MIEEEVEEIKRLHEEKIQRLHDKIAPFAEPRGIALLGDDGLVAMEDFRLMDVEHIIHELAHCTLLGIDVHDHDCMEKLTALMQRTPEYHQKLNEVETFAVTIEVLRRLGVDIVVDDFWHSLEIAGYGFETPNDGRIGLLDPISNRRTPQAVRAERWCREFFDIFPKSPRGDAAAHRLINLFEEEP